MTPVVWSNANIRRYGCCCVTGSKDFSGSCVPVRLSCRSLEQTVYLWHSRRDFEGFPSNYKSLKISILRQALYYATVCNEGQRSGCELRINLDWRNQRWKLPYQIIPPCQGRLVSCALLGLLCFMDAHLSSAPKSCPSLVVECFLVHM